MSDLPMEADLAAWGKVVQLQTVGRRSGEPRVVTIGFVAVGDGSLLVAAASAETDWAANLRAGSSCAVALGGRWRRCTARELANDERSEAVRELILKYGTPAERLGAGPAFRLDPAP